MADRTPSPTRRPAPLAEQPGPVPDPPAPGCNVPTCPEAPEWQGLCSAHRQTHRGLADPKEPR